MCGEGMNRNWIIVIMLKLTVCPLTIIIVFWHSIGEDKRSHLWMGDWHMTREWITNKLTSHGTELWNCWVCEEPYSRVRTSHFSIRHHRTLMLHFVLEDKRNNKMIDAVCDVGGCITNTIDGRDVSAELQWIDWEQGRACRNWMVTYLQKRRG